MAEDALIGRLARISAELQAGSVRHAVIGALALAAWGRPRATFDLDLLVPGDDDTVARLRVAAARAGLDQVNRRVVAFRRIRLLRMAAVEADGAVITVDFVMTAPEVAEEMFARAKVGEVGGRALHVVSPEDLILLKLLRFADQDRVDVTGLADAVTLDRRYLSAGARRLGILDRVREVGLAPRPRRRRRKR